MADAQAILNQSKEFFARNNPIDIIVQNAMETYNNMVTFKSKMKLLRYKFMLAQQQLNRMEENLNQASPYDIRGNKIDRPY